MIVNVNYLRQEIELIREQLDSRLVDTNKVNTKEILLLSNRLDNLINSYVKLINSDKITVNF